MKNFSLLLLSVVTVGACGGGGGSGGDGSGIPSSTLLKDITVAQSTQLCHYAADVFPERSVTCDSQAETIGINDATDCTDSDPLEVADTCTATVGDAESCFEALGNLSDAEWCMLSAEPAACARFNADTCDTGGGGSGSAAAPPKGTPDHLAWLRGRAAAFSGH